MAGKLIVHASNKYMGILKQHIYLNGQKVKSIKSRETAAFDITEPTTVQTRIGCYGKAEAIQVLPNEITVLSTAVNCLTYKCTFKVDARRTQHQNTPSDSTQPSSENTMVFLKKLIGEYKKTYSTAVEIQVDNEEFEEEIFAELKSAGYISSYAYAFQANGDYWKCTLTEEAINIFAPNCKPPIVNKINNANNNTGNTSNSNIMTLLIAVVVIIFLVFLIKACTDETTTYYVDRNGDGHLNPGEAVWYEDDNGIHFFD